ncbi:MAG: AmmeMemoRadiSam system radical SAM enzyme [Candidatus Latescibacteria bacterium]|nr:AmmeMemoRadiSam system radical SAM enzyme [Candidatus Latescibacterota bacterium]
MKEAMFYQPGQENEVVCGLCNQHCHIKEGKRGFCRVRKNQGGKLYSLVYGRLVAENSDPIEKKPLFHYLPGTTALSVATAGCNFECKFCQNWEISQFRPEQVQTVTVPPENLVRMARSEGHPTIAYTYSEPVIFYEYMHDTAAVGRENGIGSVIISNGYIHEEPLRELCQHLTGVKIDLKAFTETFYRDQCAGRLEPVLKALEILTDIRIHTEIVVLIIPTLNDSTEEIGEMSRWIVSHMGEEVPLHFSRFYPTYRLKNLPPTPIETLERARRVAMDAGLQYVYIGNVPIHEAEHTYCPSCGKVVIHRVGYRTDLSGLRDGGCASCGHKIPGVWTQQQALSFKPG